MKIILFLCLCITFPALAQKGDTDTIHWRADYKLKPEDFTGTPDRQSGNDAVTTSGAEVTSRFSTDTSLQFKVYCVFYKSSSWITEKKDSSNLLRHEQGHFDIMEIFARKLRAELKSLENLNYVKNKSFVLQKQESLVNSIMKEKDSLSKLYDLQTDFSRNRGQQVRWSEKIAEILRDCNTEQDAERAVQLLKE